MTAATHYSQKIPSNTRHTANTVTLWPRTRNTLTWCRTSHANTSSTWTQRAY